MLKREIHNEKGKTKQNQGSKQSKQPQRLHLIRTYIRKYKGYEWERQKEQGPIGNTKT